MPHVNRRVGESLIVEVYEKDNNMFIPVGRIERLSCVPDL